MSTTTVCIFYYVIYVLK